jgi:hypothetical protein
MTNEQNEVIAWWHSGRDYQMGVMLLARFSKNKVLVHTLMKPGKERFGGKAKLEYELPKAVGLSKQETAKAKIPEGFNVAVNNPPLPAAPPPLKEGDEKHKHLIPLVNSKPIKDYPKIIRRLKYEYSDLYTSRSIKHKTMVAVPEENSAKNTTARAGLLAEIKAISKQMDKLYGFIDAYETTGTIPLEEEIWPKQKEPEGLPSDVDALKKIKKNLQSANTKDHHQLLFQQNKKADTESPMPDGPKRKRIELRIIDREQRIKEIDEKLFEIEVNL